MPAVEREPDSPPLPTGTVTFLFTDIEGSTAKWERDPEAMTVALAAHNRILRGAIDGNSGAVFETAGDSFVAVFAEPPDGLRAALDAQLALVHAEWPDPPGPIKVRMALHTGTAERRPDGYHAQHALSLMSRILACGHGGQVLLSAAAHDLVEHQLPAGVALTTLGEHRLRDLRTPQWIHQVVATDPPWLLPAAFPPLRTPVAATHHLPVPPTPLIGREQQVAEVIAMMRPPRARIVTLTGPGGTGKTRVGLQVAQELSGGYEHGACLVDLAPISDVDLVASTVATTLGVAEVAGEPLMATLESTLKERRMLLLVDNFEQVSAAAHQVGRLVAAAPGLSVLVTSRVPLQINGEHEYPIPPLTLPDTRRLPQLENLSRNASVRLFVERAQAINPGFALTDDNARAVAEICVRLDGLPLAIELAAARTRLMTPPAIAARLHNRLDLLTGGRRDADARQRTLRATIEWSYNLLDEAEQRLFRRLGVFVGGRTLRAIEAVCDADGRLGIDVVDGVETLLYSSLLRHEETSVLEPRFTMLETIHEFATDKLASLGELEELRLAHARYFLDIAEAAGIDAAGNRIDAGGLEEIDVEHANIRRALEFALAGAERDEAEPAAIALRLASAMARFWYLRSHWSESADWFSAVLEKAGTTPASAWSGVLHGAGQLAVERGDYAAGRAFFERCVAASRLAGDEAGAAFALGKVGDAAYALGDFTAAHNYLQEGLFQTRRLGDPFNTARLMGCLGELLRAQGEFAEARRLNDDAVALLVEAGQGSSSRIGVIVCNLGNALLREGDVDRAATVLADALSIAERLGSTIDIAIAVLGLGGVAAAHAEPLRAARLLGASEALIEELGASLWPADRLDLEHHLAVTRAQTDAEAFAKAHQQGRAMSVEDTIRLATGAAPRQ